MKLFNKLLCSIFIYLCFSGIALASDISVTNDIQIIDSLNKGWIFEFSDEINPMTINSNNIYIEDNDGRLLDLTLSTASYINDSNVLIIYPNEPYKNHSIYTLHIDRNLESIYNESLNKPISLKFKVILSKETLSFLAKQNIKESLKETDSNINISSFNITYTDARLIIDTILNETPEIIHYNYDKIYFDPKTELAKSIKFHYTERSSVRDSELDALHSKVDLTLKNQNLMSQDQVQVISSLYNSLINRTSFSANKKHIESAYSVLVNKTGSCSGYAKAFQLYLNKLGYETKLIKGSYNKEAHMWVSANLFGSWYHFDPAADDCTNSIPRKYFMVKDSTILKDHKIGYDFNKVYEIFEDEDEELSYIKNMKIDFYDATKDE